MSGRRYLAQIGLAVALVLGHAWGPAYAPAYAAVPDTGIADFEYKGLITPSAEKPQSKLWYNDGRWWADMLYSDGDHYIFYLNRTTQQWVKTPTRLDTRTRTKSDCLWDGAHLYVASGGGLESTNADLDGVLYRFSYNAITKTYSRDFGPITIRPGGAETLVIDKDSTGRLWITYAQAGEIYLSHSLGSDTQWNTPFAMPAAGVNEHIGSDDISTLVAFNGNIGVLWSNQLDNTVYFAFHSDSAPDTSWHGEVVIQGPNIADDHINLKSIPGDTSGRVYAVIKTSIPTTTADTPRILLVTRQPNGQWQSSIVSSGADHQTRPILLIDPGQNQLSIFSADEGGGTIYLKQAALNDPHFAAGKGTPFISNAAYTIIDNPTSTKQTVSTASGVVVLASDDSHKRYLHNTINIGPEPELSRQVYLSIVRR
jgi:hypothetical protein